MYLREKEVFVGSLEPLCEEEGLLPPWSRVLSYCSNKKLLNYKGITFLEFMKESRVQGKQLAKFPSEYWHFQGDMGWKPRSPHGRVVLS
jgi:hypothetical protein